MIYTPSERLVLPGISKISIETCYEWESVGRSRRRMMWRKWKREKENSHGKLIISTSEIFAYFLFRKINK